MKLRISRSVSHFFLMPHKDGQPNATLATELKSTSPKYLVCFVSHEDVSTSLNGTCMERGINHLCDDIF